MATKNINVKKGNSTSVEMTPDQVREFTRCAKDPIYFIENYIFVRHPVRGRTQFRLYDYQKRLVNTYHDNKDVITKCPRQGGKSETSCAYLFWFSIFNKDKTVLITSNKHKNSSEMISRIKYMYENLPDFLKPGVTDDGWNKLSLKFETGSRIISDATSETTGRGGSFSILYCLGGETTVTVRNKNTGEVSVVSLQDLYHTTSGSRRDAFSSNEDYEILTPHSWVDFAGVLQTPDKEVCRISLSDGTYVDATAEHSFFSDGKRVQMQHLQVGSHIDTTTSQPIVESVQSLGECNVYDLVEVKNIDHSFLVNGNIITKNCDETAFVRPTIQAEFWASISPTLATGGKMFMTSTPNGDSDLFATLWRGAVAGTNGMKYVSVAWDEVPGRDAEFKRREIAKNGELKWLQEYETVFVSSDPLLIDSLKASQLKTHEHKSQELGVKIWKDFEKQEQIKYQQSTSQQVQNYNLHNQWHNPNRQEAVETKVYDKQCIVTVDPSKGVERDFTVVQVFSYPGLEQMMELRSNKSKTGDIYIALKRIWEKADKAGWQVYFTVENNGVGEGLLALFANDEALPENVELVSEVGQIGLNTSAKSKALGCKIFKEFVEGGVLKLNSRDLVHEIKNFILTGGTYKAKEGATDDCVMATILTCRVVKQLAAYDETAFDMLYSVEESEESKHEFDDTDSDDYDEMPMIF